MKYSLFVGLLAVAVVNGRATSLYNSRATTLYYGDKGSETVERLRRVPDGWTNVGAPHEDRKLHFRIAMRSENPDLLERTLIEVSSPGHPRYGKHLGRAEIEDLVKPRAESTATVLDWLAQSGIEKRDIHVDGEWISFHAPVKRAEEMMGTSFKTYQSQVRPNVKKIRSLSYSVPKEVRSHIDMIEPTTRFGRIHAESSNVHSQEEVPFTVASVQSEAGMNVTQCNIAITPNCLAEMYNFADYKPAPESKACVKLDVNGFLDQFARYSDFEKFQKKYALDHAKYNFTFQSVNGGLLTQNSTKDSGEANLDIQYTAGLVGPNIKTIFYSTPGNGEWKADLDQPKVNGNEPYLDFFTYYSKLENHELPSVLSTSYGEDEQSVPATYAKKVCDMIGQLGARGVSVIFSSGDTGVGSACQTNDGKNTTRFLPIFPAACPYVTSVGATTGVQPEGGVSFSSGGFSDLFPRPKYQEDAVKGYLTKLGKQWEGLYNPNGRGFPDVSAQGQNFRVFDKGTETSIDGTSASAPTFASVIALLNNARMAAGKPAMGFLNPWIYEKGYKGLNDITLGGSTGCIGTDIYSGLPAPLVPYASWNATEGWDPVTGHGTPDFGKMKEIALAQ